MYGSSGGFGVGVTITGLRSWTPEALPPGVTDPAELVPAGMVERPARLGEMVPVARRTDAGLATELQRVQLVDAMLAAYKAELIVELAARRPSCADVPAGRPGAAAAREEEEAEAAEAGISEFFADELALILNCSRSSASTQLGQSVTLLNRLPRTWAALADGELDWPRARGLATELGAPADDTDPAVVAAVEAAVLPTATERSVRRLREAARAELLARDAAAVARRRRLVERAADVTVRPLRDGMAELSATLPAGLAAACRDTVDQLARMVKSGGDPRAIGQLRTIVLSDLILRPWDTTRPAVTAFVTIDAPLNGLGSTVTAPGEPAPVADVDGLPITIGQLRELLEQLDAACPGGLRAPAGGNLTIALTDPVSGRLRASIDRRELERLLRRGCPTHPDDDACGCSVVDRPPPVDRYRPTPAQRRFVKTRDRSCRHPGCHNKAGWADLDHVIAHAVGGPSACENLCCLCRRHHRLKTQAPGWIFAMSGDGLLTVTTPSGVTRTTRPPGYRLPPDDAVAPPGQPHTGWQPLHPDAASSQTDDPPPF